MSKAPPMPKLEPEEGDIERRTAYTRLNPNGDKEFVVDDDEETLNELAEAIMSMFESVSFSGPLPTGGGMGSPEQLQTDRRHNQPDSPLMVSLDGDQERANQDDLNNMTSRTVKQADGPEELRAKSKYGANAKGNDLPIKNIAGYRGDGLDYGVTHSESFTGTGAIAIGPGGGYNPIDDDDDEDDEDNKHDTDYVEESYDGSLRPPMESDMSKDDILTEELNQVINEWEPSFASGEYSPGEYQMQSAPGDGVADRKPTKDKVGAYDTDTSQDGKEWPRDHKETEAMGKVEKDGTDHKPAGTHESSVAEPTDGHQDKVGHDWPKEAKNSGSGVAEPFEGDRWSDGGTLKNSGQDEMDNSGADQKLPSNGPITGTSGPQMGQMEGWSPQGIGSLMEGEFNLQDLFNNYASDHGRVVCLEDFQALCNAHGCTSRLDERSLLQLMESNQQFMFYQGEDANGYYWQPNAITEGGLPDFIKNKNDDGESKTCSDCNCSPCECDDDDCNMAEGKKRRPFGRTISELQVRSPQDESQPYGEEGRSPMGDPHFDDPMGGGGGLGMDEPGMGGAEEYGDMLGGAGSLDAQHGPGAFGDHGASTDSCPECGEMTSPGEESCPGCGAPVGGDPMDDMAGGMEDDIAGLDDEMDYDSMDAGGPMGSGMDDDPMGGFGGGMGDQMGGPMGGGMGDEFGMDDPMGGPMDGPMGDEFGMGDPMGDELGMDDPMGGPMGDEFGMEDDPRGGGRMPFESATLVNSPRIMEALNGFMSSAHRILEHNHDFHREHIAEALNYSWVYHARNVNPSKAPAKVRSTIRGLMENFPGFRPVMEGGSDAMDAGDGTAIGTGGADNSSDFLAKKDQPGPDEMKDEGEPLGKSQKNTYEETPVISGTHKGMDGKGSVAQSVKENVARLSKHTQKALREGARKNLRGKYGVRFSLIVTEGNRRNKTTARKRLSEALADAEELLQLHNSDDVALEAVFSDINGTVALKQDIPLFTIKPRGLMVSEGKAIFRFKRTAESFANGLVTEGASCRVIPHNWGRAVMAKVPYRIAASVFRTLKK